MIYLDYKMDFGGSIKQWYITEMPTEYQIDDKHKEVVEAFLQRKTLFFKTVNDAWMQDTTFPDSYYPELEYKIGYSLEFEKVESFTKNDTDKTNIAILGDVSKALEEVAKVMQYGANKYSRKNWDKVDDKERYISATYRHLMLGYQQGEAIDKESGLSHLAHAICSLLFLLELDKRG